MAEMVGTSLTGLSLFLLVQNFLSNSICNVMDRAAYNILSGEEVIGFISQCFDENDNACVKSNNQ